MSDPQLPAELLDHIVDLLHDKISLRNCCLLSKSWIPRARKHLFAHIKFHDVEELQSWKGTFPDPSTSPAYYTKTLFVYCASAAIAADAKEGGWIKAFSRVERLKVTCGGILPIDSLVPFHGFSPAVKTLCVDLALPPSSEVFDLILSFPLLEDLTVTAYDNRSADSSDGPDKSWRTIQPSSPPMLSGSLKLFLGGRVSRLARRLLSTPGGIHFRELDLAWFREEDIMLVAALVGGCSHTLESLIITCYGDLTSMSIQHLRPRQ